MARLDAFLALGRQQGCSDVHLTVGLPPLVRIDGDLVPVDHGDVSIEEAEIMLAEILDDEQGYRFQETGSVDLSYTSSGAGRFRVNVCRQSRGISFVCRVIPERVIPLEKLGLPKVLSTLAGLNSGLILVTGAAGTGKSTTMAAVVNEINERRALKIVTLEDPVEFIHENKQSLVIQREVGPDVVDFRDGLRSALRQDVDVILVGELRDRETISLALEASETGHLVLATLQSRGATQTIDRILDAFSSDAHSQVLSTLADNLRCVVSQDLVRAADGRGRRAAAEILIVTPAVSKLLREGKTFQIPGAISTGRRYGMQLMDQALMTLIQSGEIDPDEAYRASREKRDFAHFRIEPPTVIEMEAAEHEPETDVEPDAQEPPQTEVKPFRGGNFAEAFWKTGT